MKGSHVLSLVLFLILFVFVSGLDAGLTSIHEDPKPSDTAAPDASNPVHSRQIVQKLPVMFIENAGQFDYSARFKVHGGDKSIWLTKDAIWITVLEPAGALSAGRDEVIPDYDGRFRGDNARSADTMRRGVNIRLSFVGANPEPEIQPFNPLTSTVSYFIGDDPQKWDADVPVWGGVRYVGLYPDLDLEIVAGGQGGELLLVCHSSSCQEALGLVQLQIDGADSVVVEGHHLRIETAIGPLELPSLTIISHLGTYIEADGLQKAISGDKVVAPFSALSKSPAGAHLSLAPDDDPSELLYGTLIGGASSDQGNSLAVDASGNAYITGRTESTDFPTTPGVFDTTNNGLTDVFVARLLADGSGVDYVTYIGGSDDDDGLSLAVDLANNTFIAGQTHSPDFPTTPGAYDTTFNGYYDNFVVKLNAAGSDLVYSTFVGGVSADPSSSLAVDASGNAFIVGFTISSDFPTTPGAYDTTFNGYADAFVVKLNAAGSDLLYGTFIGGSDIDEGFSLALDSANNAYVTGRTESPDFPTTPGAFDTTHSGSTDAFAVKLNPAGSDLLYSTFVGGSNGEGGLSFAVDSANNAYVTGTTSSPDFPTTPGAYDTTYNGLGDTFVVKLNPVGSDLVYGTFIGGASADPSRSLALDSAGNVFVAGFSWSPDFPTTPEAFDTTFNGYGDAFVIELNAAGSDLLYGTFIGGSDIDEGFSLALDSANNAYVTGSTLSPDFPTTPGAFDTTFNGYKDAFVVKLNVLADVYVPYLANMPG